jgi:hypothetical protein
VEARTHPACHDDDDECGRGGGGGGEREDGEEAAVTGKKHGGCTPGLSGVRFTPHRNRP